MTSRKWALVAAAGLLAAATAGFLTAEDKSADTPRPADEQAVRAAAQAFAAAFNSGDARAVAGQWTEAGECHDATGTALVGRSAIEQAFADYFKDNPRARVEVLVESIRFPAPDVAIEEGLLRQSASGKDLPATTVYTATHVRTGGRWLTAVSREWGAGEDRLDDLAWLVGRWNGDLKDHQVTLTITRDGQKAFLTGRFETRTGDKAVAIGSLRIGPDSQTGRLRSWHFDEDGGHGQAVWVRDGNRWVLDAVGVLADGTETASVNILGRLNNDEITWQSIDRVLGDRDLPDTTPIKLTRVPSAR